MKISIADRCSTLFNAWLSQRYSPNLTNADKLLANLTRIGNIDREEWSKSFDIICNSLCLYDLTLIHEMVIENLRINNEGNLIIDTAFTMLNPDEEPLYASFSLDNSLNLLEEAKDNTSYSVEELGANPAQFYALDEVKEKGWINETENIQPVIHPNIKANLSSPLFSKSYHSLLLFPQLENLIDAPNCSATENHADQLFKPSTPGLVQE